MNYNIDKTDQNAILASITKKPTHKKSLFRAISIRYCTLYENKSDLNDLDLKEFQMLEHAFHSQNIDLCLDSDDEPVYYALNSTQ